jgi:GTP cyclohydrolase I
MNAKETEAWIKKGVTFSTDEELVRELLIRLGENPDREGLQETPKRFVKFMKEFLTPPVFNMTTFEKETYDQMIIQRNIPFHSLCEHHMAVIDGVGYIAYIPDKRIVGISKLARTLETFSRRLQNQERITEQVAEFLMDKLQPKGVAVSLTARHYCMEMRGVKKHDTYTTTTALKGIFLTDPVAKSEFFSFINQK